MKHNRFFSKLNYVSEPAIQHPYILVFLLLFKLIVKSKYRYWFQVANIDIGSKILSILSFPSYFVTYMYDLLSNEGFIKRVISYFFAPFSKDIA